jgi:hypothetical protein
MNHIEEHSSVAEDEEDLQRIIAGYTTPAYPKDRSPWFIVLIHTKQGNTVLLFTIDHAICDGVGFIRALNALLADVSTQLPQPKYFSNMAFTERLKLYWKFLIELPAYIISVVKMKPDMASYFKHPDPNAGKIIRWSKSLSKSTMENIRQKFPGSTINDIASAVIFASLVKYTAKHKDLLPSLTHCDVSYPACMRQSDDLSLNNSIGKLKVELSWVEQKTTGELVRCISQQSMATKWYLPFMSHKFANLLTTLLSLFNGAIKWGFNSVVDCSPLLISNVAGPPQGITIMNRDVRKVIFIPAYHLQGGKSVKVTTLC